jgi:hypothetical protein
VIERVAEITSGQEGGSAVGRCGGAVGRHGDAMAGLTGVPLLELRSMADSVF